MFIFIPSFFGFMAGFAVNLYFYQDIKPYLDKLPIDFSIPEISRDKDAQDPGYDPFTSHERAIIETVKRVSPAVVSIVASRDVPVFEEYYVNPFEGSPFEDFFREFELRVPQQRQRGSEQREIAAGTGFVISADGLILTNKHVVSLEGADYIVYTNDGKKLQGKVLAVDPVNDIAVLKVDSAGDLASVALGDSSGLEIGQSVIAIGNALGEFRNTVSVGVVSGLGRTLRAGGAGLSEILEDVIQTDAAINEGNSGGPLLNLRGEVIGINTAIVSGAQNIGFAIPINQAKRDITQVKILGKISYPYLGVWHTIINADLQKQYGLSVAHGAWVGRDEKGAKTEGAVVAGSPAEKAGLKRDDIILEFGSRKITTDATLRELMQEYNPGDKIALKILRDTMELTLEVVLGERKE